jgi:hypothetical protein
MTRHQEIVWRDAAYHYGTDAAERLLRHWRPVSAENAKQRYEACEAVASYIADDAMRGGQPSDVLRAWVNARDEDGE